MSKRTYNISDTGRRVGEDHQRAKLTDEQVDLIRDLYDEGFAGYRTLARAFGVSRLTIRDIVMFRRRNVTVMGSKTVCIKPKG